MIHPPAGVYWQGWVMISAALVLCLVGFRTLRNDRRRSELEAREAAQVFADQLAVECLNAIWRDNELPDAEWLEGSWKADKTDFSQVETGINWIRQFIVGSSDKSETSGSAVFLTGAEGEIIFPPLPNQRRIVSEPQAIRSMLEDAEPEIRAFATEWREISQIWESGILPRTLTKRLETFIQKEPPAPLNSLAWSRLAFIYSQIGDFRSSFSAHAEAGLNDLSFGLAGSSGARLDLLSLMELLRMTLLNEVNLQFAGERKSVAPRDDDTSSPSALRFQTRESWVRQIINRFRWEGIWGNSISTMESLEEITSEMRESLDESSEVSADLVRVVEKEIQSLLAFERWMLSLRNLSFWINTQAPWNLGRADFIQSSRSGSDFQKPWKWSPPGASEAWIWRWVHASASSTESGAKRYTWLIGISESELGSRSREWLERMDESGLWSVSVTALMESDAKSRTEQDPLQLQPWTLDSEQDSAVERIETRITARADFGSADKGIQGVVQVWMRDESAFFERVDQRMYWMSGVLLMALTGMAVGTYSSWKGMLRERKVSQLKSNLVSSVSHELRAPIASMRLLAEELAQSDPEVSELSQKQQKEYISLIFRECCRLSGLVENTMDFSRMERGLKQYEFERLDVVALIQDTLGRMRPLAMERQLKLSFDNQLEESVERQEDPCWDGVSVQQALTNLLDNAVKRARSGSEVVVGIKSVFREGVCFFNLWVKDEGPGVPPTERERIFDMFYRSGDELRRETTGVGIGLALARSIVEAHRGRIWVEDRKDGKSGSIFNMELPEDIVN